MNDKPIIDWDKYFERIRNIEIEKKQLRAKNRNLCMDVKLWKKRTEEAANAVEEFEKLQVENEQLKDSLQSLYDEQNGPPLIRNKESWQKAMDEADKLLLRVSKKPSRNKGENP